MGGRPRARRGGVACLPRRMRSQDSNLSRAYMSAARIALNMDIIAICAKASRNHTRQTPKKNHFGLWRVSLREDFAHNAMMSMLSAIRAADMYAKGKVSIPRPHSTRKARYAAAPCARSPTHQSRILTRYTVTEHRVY